MADITLPWVDEQKFETVDEFALDDIAIPWLTEDKLDANISVRGRVDTVNVYANYTITNFTASWGWWSTTAPLTAAWSSWTSDFTMTSNVVTIINPWRYLVSCCLRYDNVATWEEIVIFRYRNSWWTDYAAQQTYFDWANDFVTLTTTLALNANDTLKAEVTNTDTFSVDVVAISPLRITKL